MKLPEIQHPTYEVPLLSLKKPVRYRPFTVREEKIMMMALEGGSMEDIVNALKQIIINCAVEELDVENLPMVDIETMFLHLRARSIGEQTTQFFKCKNEIDVEGKGIKECGMLIDIPVKFLEVPIVNADRSPDIRFNDELGLKMKYPTLALTRLLTTIEPEDLEVTVVANCIETIYTKDEVFKAEDATAEELIEFVMKLPTDKYELIKDFSFNTPRNQLVVEKKCVKCGFDHKITLEGIQDFFE
jgi:hypothetical protein